MSRPDPGEPIPGMTWRAVEAGPDWRLIDPARTVGASPTGKRCRFTVDHRVTCRRPAVAELNRRLWRSRTGRVDSWWAYCEDHLYGKWIEDGRVMRWQMRSAQWPR